MTQKLCVNVGRSSETPIVVFTSQPLFIFLETYQGSKHTDKIPDRSDYANPFQELIWQRYQIFLISKIFGLNHTPIGVYAKLARNFRFLAQMTLDPTRFFQPLQKLLYLCYFILYFHHKVASPNCSASLSVTFTSSWCSSTHRTSMERKSCKHRQFCKLFFFFSQNLKCIIFKVCFNFS